MPGARTRRRKAQLARYHVALFQNTKGAKLTRALVEKLQAQLEAKLATPPDQTDITVWLESPGGDAQAAYKLFLELRYRCASLSAVVPDYAKSAATLFLLGVDTIYMAPAAELGPLDVQVSHPHREDDIVSGLDIADSLNYLGTTAVDLMLRGGATVRDVTGLPRSEVIKDMSTFAVKLFEPLTSKLDPHVIHRAANQLKVAEHYAKRMLKRRNTSAKHRLSDGEADGLMKRLISDYPTHEFVICREEAADLKLPIESAEQHPDWPVIAQLHRQASQGPRNLLEVFTQKEVDSVAEVLKAKDTPQRKEGRANAPAKPPRVAKVPTPVPPATEGRRPKGTEAPTGS